jgi:SAM-dependent methyltransferase
MSMKQVEVDWNKYAEQYDNVTISGSNPAYLELIEKLKSVFNQYPIQKGSLVVDLGGGTGNFALPLAEKFPDSHFVIVDLSQVMLEIANKKAVKKGLKNVETVRRDVEDIQYLTDKYNRPISTVIMMHCLYATPSLNDPDKPKRILKNVFNGLDHNDSLFVISDINRPLRTGNWIPYCLWHTYKWMGSLKKTLAFFKENDQSKLANRYIDVKQEEGSYLLCGIDELVDMIKTAGFSKILEKNDTYYRSRDNFVVAMK